MSYKIEKQPNGKYKIRVWGKTNEFGKIPTKQISNINTIAVAKNKALEMEENLNNNTKNFKELTFNELYKQYGETKFKTMSPTTLKNKENFSKEVLNYWGKVKIGNINTKNVQEWVNKLENKENPHKKGYKLKKSTIQEYVKVLKTVINWAVAQDYLEYNKIKKIEYREDEDIFEPTILSPQQIKEILSTLKRDFYNLYIPVLISILADPRRGEVLGISYDDIDFENGLIYLSQSAYEENGKKKIKKKLKSKTSRRCLVMSEFLKHELIEHKKLNRYLDSNFVCDNIFIGSIKPSYVSHKFHDFVKQKFDINIRFHDLRHNFNQLCFENGTDLSTRSKMMGHASEKITNSVYTHFSKNKAKEAVETLTTSIGLNYNV